MGMSYDPQQPSESASSSHTPPYNSSPFPLPHAPYQAQPPWDSRSPTSQNNMPPLPPTAPLSSTTRSSQRNIIALLTLIGSLLLITGGAWKIIIALSIPLPRASFDNTPTMLFAMQMWGSPVLFGAGALGLYLSIRSLRALRSRPYTLPLIWTFLALCGIGIAVALIINLPPRVIRISDPQQPSLWAIVLLALEMLTIAIFLLGLSTWALQRSSPTTWQRILTAFVVGIGVALLLELALRLLTNQIFLTVGILGQCPPQYYFPICSPSRAVISDIVPFIVPFGILLLVGSLLRSVLLTPLVRRVSSRGEIFQLGLACGVGFVFARGIELSIIHSFNMVSVSQLITADTIGLSLRVVSPSPFDWTWIALFNANFALGACLSLSLGILTWSCWFGRKPDLGSILAGLFCLLLAGIFTFLTLAEYGDLILGVLLQERVLVLPTRLFAEVGTDFSTELEIDFSQVFMTLKLLLSLVVFLITLVILRVTTRRSTQ